MSFHKNKIIILAISMAFFVASFFVYTYNSATEYPKKLTTVTAASSIQKSQSLSISNASPNTRSNPQTKLISSPTLQILKPENAMSEEIEVKVIENKQGKQEQKNESIIITQSTIEPKPEVIVETKTEASILPKQIVSTNSESVKYKNFEGAQWKEVFEKARLNYENVTENYGGLDYFGDSNVNQVAIDLAVQRGFTKRSLVADPSKLIYVEGYLVQPKMADAIRGLFKEMRENGLSITFLSGYRDIQEQSTVFGDEFYKQSIISKNREISNQEILNHKADSVLNKSYDTVALPGYSRHHYGYTIDVTEPGTYYKNFESTKAYEWLSKDNFFNVKKYGIIPSYPKGVEYQGPEPESWEFVYVGKDNLVN